jgi:hypothetical protein
VIGETRSRDGWGRQMAVGVVTALLGAALGAWSGAYRAGVLIGMLQQREDENEHRINEIAGWRDAHTRGDMVHQENNDGKMHELNTRLSTLEGSVRQFHDDYWKQRNR